MWDLNPPFLFTIIAASSSDNSWIAAVVAVVVTVPAVVILALLLFGAFALWIWYRRGRAVRYTHPPKAPLHAAPLRLLGHLSAPEHEILTPSHLLFSMC